MLTAFIDDSGSHGGAEAFILAGYVASQPRWTRFRKDWRTTLNSGPRSIEYLKTKQAERLQDQFKGWSREERDAKLHEFAGVVNAHAEFGVVATLSRHDYDVIVRSYAAEHPFMAGEPLFNTVFGPYSLLFANLVFALLAEAMARKESIEFVLDSQPEKGGVAFRTFRDHVPEFFRNLKGGHLVRYIGSLTYATEQDEVALQAADMLAWHENRHRMRNQVEGARPIYTKLNRVRMVRTETTPELMRELVHNAKLGIDPYDPIHIADA